MNNVVSEAPQHRVLVVDDDESVRALVAAMLRRGGFDVAQAADGLQGLVAAHSARPDVIVTDLNMPRCSGDRLCAELKRDAATAHIPVVMMTGGTPDEAQLRKLGCVALLHKPLSRSVVDCVRSVLKGSPHGDAQLADSAAPRVRAVA